MKHDYIYQTVEQVIRRYKTRNPFNILLEMNVVVSETDAYKRLKGYCLMLNRTSYVMINSSLSDQEKRMVAAHELGHLLLHRSQLRFAPMHDMSVCDRSSGTEYEANLFAANLLLTDEDVLCQAEDEGSDYFKLCSTLNADPALMNFKIHNMIQRGHKLVLPMDVKSKFLAS